MDTKVNRPKRVPLHEQRNSKLEVSNLDPKFVYRWVNDKPGRIESFKLAGWTIATGEETVIYKQAGDASSIGSGLKQNVNSNPELASQAILMKIPKEFYDEDQKVKQVEVDQIAKSYDPENTLNTDEFGKLKIENGV